MNVFFDVDFTLVMGDGSLRPRTREAFEQIADMGHCIYVWSGVGIRRWDMRRHGLHDLVAGYFVKPLSDYRRRLPEFGIDVIPDFVVDDHVAVVDAFGGFHMPDTATDDDQSLAQMIEVLRVRTNSSAR